MLSDVRCFKTVTGHAWGRVGHIAGDVAIIETAERYRFPVELLQFITVVDSPDIVACTVNLDIVVAGILSRLNLWRLWNVVQLTCEPFNVWCNRIDAGPVSDIIEFPFGYRTSVLIIEFTVHA